MLNDIFIYMKDWVTLTKARSGSVESNPREIHINSHETWRTRSPHAFFLNPSRIVFHLYPLVMTVA